MVLLVAGCSNGGPDRAASKPSASADLPLKAVALLRAVRDPQNVKPADWKGRSAEQLERDAKAVCADVADGGPISDVVKRQAKRASVSYFDADYFMKASAVLYCPRFKSTVGYLQ